MKEDQAHRILSPYFDRLAFAVARGFETYRTKYPHKTIHRRTTVANVLCDEIRAEVVNTFDEDMPRIKPIEQRHGLRLLGVQGESGEIEILLWFKKVDSQRRAKSYPTKNAKRMLAGGNLELFKKATVLIVGYHLNQEETRILSVSISRPLNGRSEWFIDLVIPQTADNVVRMHGPGSSASTGHRVVIRRIRQDRLGNDVQS